MTLCSASVLAIYGIGSFSRYFSNKLIFYTLVLQFFSRDYNYYWSLA
jgi:hypothetical protein